MDENYKIFVATIYGEAAGQSEASWKAIANVVMNRLEYRHEWKKYKTPTEVIKGSGFDAYTSHNQPYKEAYKYLSGGVLSSTIKNRVEALESAVRDIYNKVETDNADGAVLYYSPKAQDQLYGKPPAWKFELLEEVKVAGAEKDDFKFFRYKRVAKYKFSAKGMDSSKTKKEVSIEIDGKKKIVKTDVFGNLPVLITDLIGKKIVVSIKNSKEEFVEVYNSVVKNVEVSIDFIRNKVVVNSETKKHSGVPEQYSKREHVVQHGQSLSQIAMIYNLSLSELCAINKIKNINLIKVGQKLVVVVENKNTKKTNKPTVKPTVKPPSEVVDKYEGRDKSGEPRVVVGAVPSNSGLIEGILFPIENSDRKSYKQGAGLFGYPRGKRRHGGCDIYAPLGTPVRAVADGVVAIVRDFYCKTHQVVIVHDGFVVRYGEVDSKTIKVRPGDKVKRGEVIAYIGLLIIEGKPYHTTMLHFELYNSEKCPIKFSLTNHSNPPYQRRDDLINPTKTLDAAKNA